jgi:autotransporter-associated beta strand protein
MALVLTLMGVAGAWQAGATNYVWKNVYDKSWSDSTQWTPAGVPGASDTVTYDYTGLGGNVWARIGLNDQAVDTFRSVGAFNTGGKPWNPDPAAAKLTVGSLFLYTNGLQGTASFNAALAGPTCEVRVEAGCLTLTSANNTFAGGITINGGILYGDKGGTLGASGQTISLGSTDAGNRNATLQLATDDTFPQPIVARAGNDGQAIILNISSKSPRLSGTITLNKPLVLSNAYYNTDYRIYSYNVNSALRIDGAILGSYGVTVKGIGQTWLSSVNNAYTGDTVVDGGWLLMSTNVSSVVGDLRVKHGLVMIRDVGGLGAASNRLRLGAVGSFGGLGAWPVGNGGTVVFLGRDFVLEGNGGILIGHSQNPYGGSGSFNVGVPSINCVISGPGRLLIGPDNSAYLNTNNTYSGGTVIYQGTVDISGSGNYNRNVFGLGDVWIYGWRVNLRGANNIASGAKAKVGSTLALYTDYLPAIDEESTGIISLQSGAGSTVFAALSATAPQLGNGKMRIAGNIAFTGSSLQAGIDGIYRLSGDTTLTLDRAASTVGPLVGANSLQALGNTVALRDANTYEGETRVWSGTLEGTAQASGSPFGDTNGPVLVSYATWKLVGASGAQAVKKGELAFESIGIVTVDKTNAVGPLTTLEVASLVRSNKAVLAVQGGQNDLGGNERFKVTTGAPVPDPGSGMVAPYYVDYGGYFLTYGANGFARATPGKTTFTGAGPTDLVNLSATEAPGNIEVYALRTGVNVTGGNTVTLGSGGLILAGGTHTASFAFPVEGYIFCSANAMLYNAPLTAPYGFVKSGAGTLQLTNANNSIAGTITVNQGELRVDTGSRLGGAVVHLNGGSLSVTGTVSNAIELGTRGGSIGNGLKDVIISGPITGAGQLALTVGNGSLITISGTAANNTYTGGTYVDDNVKVNAGSRLGPGVVSLSYRGILTVSDNNGLPADKRLSLGSNYASVKFVTASPSCGTITGNGNVILGANGVPTTLTVGGDNADGDYFGWIVEHVQALGTTKIVKVGTGTWTLWGENTYSGGTTVNGGTLCVNNWLNPAGRVVVNSGATLDGIGTVGIVSNFGGTVKGSLSMRRLVMNAASTNEVTLSGTNAVSQYGQLSVSEGVTLDGTLKLALGFAPAVGQSFTILNNTGSAIGTQFACGSGIPATYGGRTYFFRIDYNGGDGNDVVLTRLVTGTVMTIR